MTKRIFLIFLTGILVLPLMLKADDNTGKRIILATNRIPITMYMQQPASSTTDSRQGAVCYDSILFQFHNNNKIIDVIDLKNQKKLQEISYPETTANHANNAVFGIERYAAGDRFPLLYLSRNKNNGIYIYRITGTDGNFSLQKVQTFDINATTDSYYYPDAMIDCEGGYMWFVGYTKDNWQTDDGSGNNLVKYAKMRLPKLAEGNLTLSFSNALQVFTIPWTYATQGSVFYNGKIHQMFGITGGTNRYRIINTETGKIEYETNPYKFGMDNEPENMFIYNGKLMFSTIEGALYYADDFVQ